LQKEFGPDSGEGIPRDKAKRSWDKPRKL
jgi:hypothetical protein